MKPVALGWSHLAPSMMAHKVRGDAEQPGTRVSASEVVATPQAERGRERLGGEIIGVIAPDAPRKVAVDSVEVAVEHSRERERRIP
jgi:hypothetical protein